MARSFSPNEGVNEGQGVSRNLCGLRHFIQVREKLSRLIRLPISGIGLGEHSDRIKDTLFSSTALLKFRIAL